MLTKLTEENWTILLRVFEESLPRRGDKAKNNRRFLEALVFFTVHNITWRALPASSETGIVFGSGLAIEPFRRV